MAGTVRNVCGRRWFKEVVEERQSDTGQILEMMDMFITSMVVMGSQVYAYIQIHQIVYITYV